MPSTNLNEPMCSIARSLDLLGDRWALLLIREVLFGTRRFDDFAAHLGIARNVLTQRLAKLVEAGVLVQTPLKIEGRRLGYSLSPMGEDLVPALIALMQWGDRWLHSPETVPIKVIERSNGKEVRRLQIRDASGSPLAVKDLDWTPGPGASHPAIAALVRAYEAQRVSEARPIPPVSKPAAEKLKARSKASKAA
ncbi:helix-turn-helix domain-containing protein [Variovorax humicola]|uniref:Helix-turn-helix domain-containing protein n=1 Tax=Variovorax humicola TaxID=1769758 RepID=A0ABU8W865_9BURK